MQEVVSRYRAAAEAGQSMPFFPDLRYRTLGWRCKLSDALPGGPLGAALAVAITAPLSAHFCSTVECSQDDPHTLVVPKASELRALDRAW